MLNDLRLAGRLLLRTPGWTVLVVLLLALGIGANTALFSAINGLLLRKLSVRDPDTLVRFRSVGPNDMRTDVLIYGYSAPDRGRRVEPTFSYPMYLELVKANRTLSDLFASAPLGRVNVVVNGQSDTATGFLSSGNYYQALGVTARAGRLIIPEDDRRGAAPVAVISHRYWMARFGGSRDILGAAARVNNAPVTIVGVLAPEFTGVERAVADAPDISLPLSLEPQVMLQPSTLQKSLLAAPNFWWVQVMGRLNAGATIAQVHDNLAAAFQQRARSGFDSFLDALPPTERSRSYLQGRTAVPELLVDSGSRGIYDVDPAERRALTLLTSVVALVLLIVCANVATLLLARSTARQKELSVRVALGATRVRLVRLLLTESVMIAVLGGTLGLFIGRWGQRLLPGAAGQAVPLDWRVLTFVSLVSLGTGVFFGIAPAFRALRTDVRSALGDRTTGVRSRGVLAKPLVIAQVTISIVLLVGAGLFLRTVHNLRRVDVGFNPHNVLLFRLTPALNRYEARRQMLLYERIGERVRAIGNVQSVAWSNNSLMSGRRFSNGMFVQGRVYAPGRRDTIAELVVSPGFFATMQIPVVAGRGFTERDRAGAPLVAIINEAAARAYFPGESPIGRRTGSSVEESGRFEIVGVVRDARYNSIRDPAVPTIYRPSLQSPHGAATFEVRTAGDPLALVPAIRDAARQIDPDVPLVNVTTQIEEVEGRFLQEKVFAQASVLFGGLALLVAAVGLFGVMSYSVARRTNEIGIRMALGAERRDVLLQVMRESMVLVGMGVALGVAGAIATGRLVASLLYGLAPSDGAALAAATIVMVSVAAMAAYVPARRAARVDPMLALRHE